MENTPVKRDLGYYSVEIIKDKVGNPLIIVKLKIENSHWERKLSWCPTPAELEFLYRTMKWMEKTTPKVHVQEVPVLPAIDESI